MKPFDPSSIKIDYSEMEAEERVAWRFLLRAIYDCTRGEERKRRRALREMLRWMDAPDGATAWSFEAFCLQLKVEEGYFRRKFVEFVEREGEK